MYAKYYDPLFQAKNQNHPLHAHKFGLKYIMLSKYFDFLKKN